MCTPPRSGSCSRWEGAQPHAASVGSGTRAGRTRRANKPARMIRGARFAVKEDAFPTHHLAVSGRAGRSRQPGPPTRSTKGEGLHGAAEDHLVYDCSRCVWPCNVQDGRCPSVPPCHQRGVPFAARRSCLLVPLPRDPGSPSHFQTPCHVTLQCRRLPGTKSGNFG